MALDAALLEILRCPEEHHAKLDYDEVNNTLTCVECHHVLQVEDDVPIMLRAGGTETDDHVEGTSPRATEPSEEDR